MSVRRLTVAVAAAALALSSPVVAAAQSPPAAQATVADPACTLSTSSQDYTDYAAAIGVFAANWAGEIVRDIPASAEDMSTARAWHADKTTADLPDRPEEIRAAVERINAAGAHAGYGEQEATAPLRLLLHRNEAVTGDTDDPALLTASLAELGIPAEEAWERAWDRTPQIHARAEEYRTELARCATATATGLRTTGLTGIVSGLYAANLDLLGEHVPQLWEAFPAGSSADQ